MNKIIILIKPPASLVRA